MTLPADLRRLEVDLPACPRVLVELLSLLDEAVKVEAVVTASRAKVELVSARPLASVKGYRALFDVVPGEDVSPIALRLFLRANGQPLSETWVYEWTPPAVNARVLY